MVTTSSVNKRTRAEEDAKEQLRRAHEQQVRASTADTAGYIQSLLGQKWTAYLAGVADPKAVGKWARGVRKPHPESERKLRDAYQIALLISSVDDEETARAWVIANLPNGGDRAMAAALSFISNG